MPDSIFPEFTTATESESESETLPTLRECKWDFDRDVPIFQRGEPVVVTGQEAVLVWAWNALHTVRGRHEIYTDNYGSDVEHLIGTSWSSELRSAEARQYVTECLLASPYILALRDLAVSFDGHTLTVSCSIESVYGIVRLEDYNGAYVAV